MQRVKNILKLWIPLAVVVVLLSGLMYVTAQQVLRISANDPQIQIAQDTANALSQGVSPESILPVGKVDLATSLASYVEVFDDLGKPVASSGLLHNQMPPLPPGVFDYVRQHGEDRITWQPERAVRMATVIVHYGGSQPGFVLAGRSLYEVEARTSNLELLIGLGALGTLFAALVAIAFGELVFS